MQLDRYVYLYMARFDQVGHFVIFEEHVVVLCALLFHNYFQYNKHPWRKGLVRQGGRVTRETKLGGPLARRVNRNNLVPSINTTYRDFIQVP